MEKYSTILIKFNLNFQPLSNSNYNFTLQCVIKVQLDNAIILTVHKLLGLF